MRRLLLESLESRYALASGELDPTFGDGGLVEEHFESSYGSDDTAHLIVRQVDGKVLLAGETFTGQGSSFVLSRLHPDGRVDASFGDDGVVVTHFSGDASPRALAVQPDGKILLAEDSSRFVRYLADGTIDTSFGMGGKSLVYDERFSIHSIEVQANGRILALVQEAEQANPSLSVIRIEADGRLDESFGWRGVGAGLEDIRAAKLDLQADGRFVVAAIFNHRDQEAEVRYNELHLERFTAAGDYDSTFSGDGLLTSRLSTDMGWYFDNMQFAVQVDGKPVIATMVETGGQQSPLIVRFNEDGSPDASFGSQGRVVLNQILRRDMYLRGLALHSDGDIALLGHSTISSQGADDPYSFVAVMLGDGALDPAWDEDGIFVVPDRPYQDLKGIVTQPSGDVLIAGSQIGATARDLVVFAYDASAQADTSFGTNGIASIDPAIPVSVVYSSKIQALPDGRIMVAAHTATGWVLRRYSPTGQLDPTFAGDGERMLSEIDRESYSFIDWIVQPDGKVIACIQKFYRDDQIRLVRLHADGSVDLSFGQQGIASARIAGLFLDILSASINSSGNILVAGAGDGFIGDASVDSKPSFSARFTPNGEIDTGYGSHGITIVDSEAGYHRTATMKPLISQSGEVTFFRHIFSPTSPLLAQKLSADGKSVSEVNLPGGYYPNVGNVIFDEVTVLPNGSFQVVGRASVVDENSRYGEHVVVRRVAADGTLDFSYGEDGNVIIEYPANQSDHIEVLTRQDGMVWVAIHSSDWDRPNNDIFVTQISPEGTIDSSFGVDGTVRLAVHEYDDLLDSAALLPDGILLAGRTQTDGATNLVLAKIAIDVPPSPWQNSGNPLNVDGDDDQAIAPIDALIIINELNLHGSRQLDQFADPQSIARYLDVNGDYFVSPIDALIVINWLNANPPAAMLTALPESVEGEADGAEERSAERESLDELDAAAVAWLMSSLETKEKRR